jgi:membrane-bound serine protease (ClpP class)
MSYMAMALLLILIGLVLLVLEVFIPSHGILFILSTAALVLGVTMVFFAPESEGGGLLGGLITISVLVIVIPILVGVAFHFWPRTPIGKKFFLPTPHEDAAAALPDSGDVENLRGQIGQTVTELRPSGVTLILGKRIDTKTEGMYVPAGQWVRVVDVRFGQVTVRPLNDRELGQLPEDLTQTG